MEEKPISDSSNIQDQKKLIMEKKKKVIYFLLVILLILFTRLPKTYLGYFAASEKSCNSFFPYNIVDVAKRKNYEETNKILDANINCKKLVNEGKTLFTIFKKDSAIKDADCEKESYEIKKVCYFKKAVDNREPRYCGNLVSKDFCLLGLAASTKENSACASINPLYSDRCNQLADICKDTTNSDPGCKVLSQFHCPAYYESDYDFKKKEATDCVQKYGTEYAGIPLN